MDVAGPPSLGPNAARGWLCDAMRYDIFFILDICTSLGMFCICARLTLTNGEEETRNLHKVFFYLCGEILYLRMVGEALDCRSNFRQRICR